MVAGQAWAQIQIETRPDGTKRIFNESSAQRSQRLSHRLVTPSSPYLLEMIASHARQQGLDPRLVQAVVQVESGYNPRARSRAGAMGLMQLMPGTAKSLGVSDAYDPGENIWGGTRYLRQQLERFASLPLALAAYNAGPEAVARHGGIPPYRETQGYVRKVMALAGPAGSAFATVLPAPAVAQATPRVRPPKTAPPPRQGARVYLSRDKNNKITFSTVPPKTH